MSNEEHNNEQSTSKQPADLRHAILEKSLNDKKKKSPLSAWDRLRENVSEFHSSDNSGVFVASPTSSNNSSPSSSRSSTPKPYQPSAIPPPKNKSLNPFMRSSTFDNYMHGNNSSSDSRPNITLANTTLVAAQAAGMTNFTRNFRPARHHNGVIYATSTAVQQDIYRLERDLDKILIQLHARSQHASFAESASTLVSTTVTDGSQTSTPATFGKKSVFQRQSVADMFSGSSTPHSDTMTPIKEPFRQEVTRLSFVMTSILDSIKKHKSATRLPLTGEILAVLAAPFDKIPLIVADCNQALDIFEYIRGRFTQLDSTKRVLNVLHQQLLPCKENPSFLPSTPPAYHSLVYTLTNALAQLSIQATANYTQSDLRESNVNESSMDITDFDQDQVRSGILHIMDTLANGTLIPPIGPAWSQYHTKDSIPVSIAQLCVVEGLLKCIMVGICSQSDPYQGTHETSRADLIERARDILVLQDLLQRYWIEPELDAQPAYFKIIFLISELACETFLMASVEDLKIKTSTVSLLLPLVVDKLSPAKLQNYLANRHTDQTQKMVTSNVIVMLLALLSICSLEEQPIPPQHSSNISSPNLSPRPSVADFNSENINLSIIDFQHDAQSINSFNVNNSNDASMRKTLITLKGYIEEFWKSGYKDFILTGTESMHQDATGERVARAYQNLVFHIDPAMGEEIAKKTLPSLFKRLVDTYPPALPAICNMLYELSKRFRSFFFKPVVSCVASDDEDKVSELLTLITVLRRYLSGVQFWMQDAEMINVLLLSDVGISKKQQREAASSAAAASTQSGTPQLKVNDAPHVTQWGSTTLGQCTIATEFMWAVKELRMKQRDPHRNMEEDEIAKKFLIDLERRLAVFLTAKEKMTAVPMPLRVILCNIFIDIRFFCNTTHRPGWLTRVIDWATQPVVSTPEHVYHHILPTINPDESPSPNNPHIESNMPLLHTGHLSDISYMFQRLHNVYLNVVEHLQFETNDTHDYGGTLLKPNTVLQQQQQVDEDADTRSVEVPRHKRQQVIQSMYPISRSAAISLDLDPPSASASAASNINGQDTLPMEGPALKLAKYKFENMEEINQHPFGSVFSLLAAVFTTLSSNEFGRLVRPLWERHMDDRKPQSFIPAVFLLMECGEKIPKTMIEVCTHDFYSGDPLRRLAVIQKHSSLSAFRFNVLSQEYIPISNRRRPFRGDGGAFSTPFVPTDLGSNQFTLDEPRWMAKLKNASNFPIELKRQIQELGWDDDDNGEEHEALKKVLTPLALLPSLFLEEEEERMNEDENSGLVAARQNGKAIDISKIITRRKRATTIQSLTISFLSMVDLLNDDYGGASNALRELLEYFLRDDPALFLRAFLSDLGKFKLERHKDMLTRVRYLVSMQHKLPPGFTHILFNYLAGMLKWLMREHKKKDGLILMTLIHPILAELTLSTNDLSIRDLRKNKIEHLLVSTGRFWFTHEQPAELFPRYLSNTKTPFTVLDIPPEIFSVAMLRISHIQFLTNYLARYPREVYAVKKTLQDYEPTPIPGAKKEPKWTTEETYYPDIFRRKRRETNSYIYNGDEEVFGGGGGGATVADRGDDYTKEAIRQPSQQKIDTETLSALRARIWLRFVDNLLNGLNKNYNDRDELERILQGINVIITEHDRDFGIIGQALILYTRVVTRFKRLFISNRGYTTFLPALFKVFCEVDCFPQVRSAVIFAWCRFYAVHEESFVFQMLGTLVPTILGAYGKSNELGSWMIDNLFVLMQAMHDPPHLGATSDVLGLQLQVELDDHERSIQERIDAASNPMAMPLSTAILKPLARSVTTPIAPLDINNYNNRSFELGNFVKLFLTIIAYDAGSLRAEQFVKLFRHMISRFHKLPLLKDLIDEGIAALVDVFAKFSKHAKVALGTANSTASNLGYHGVSSGIDNDTRVPGSGSRTESAQHAYGKQWQQNDKLTVRMEFVLLVHEYLKHDGVLSEVCHEKMAFIIRTVMRDYGNIKGISFKTDWLKDYLIDCLHSMADTRNYTKSFKKLLNQINSQYRSQWKTMDASDLYDGLAILLEQGQGKPVNMHDIAGIMSEKFVPFGLTVATRFNWENDTQGFNRFCNSLVRLIIAVMENSTQDVLGEIEQLAPTPGLVAHIIIPICLQYNLQWDYANTSMSGKFRPDPTGNWTRLLNYISRACSQASLMKSKSSGFSLSHLTQSMGQTAGQDGGIDAADFPDIKDGKQTPQSVALLFSLSFVAMKIILVRGSNSFNKLKGSWVQVAFFIKTALVFGQTLKFLKPKSGRSTPNMPTTPATGSLSPGGPLSGALSPGIANWTNPSPDGKTAFSFTAPLSTGTIYDFTTWRFLEFVTCYRCPLRVFLKDFIHEKLLDMGGSSSNNRSSIYAPSPSPRVSMNFGNSSSGYSPPAFVRETNSSRWKSWGGGSSPSQPQKGNTNQTSSIGIIPQLNVQDTDALSIQSPDASPTCGLGLHIPGKPSFSGFSNASQHIPPVPGSPSLSTHLASEFSDMDSSFSPAAANTNSSLHSPKQQSKSRPSSSISVPGQVLFNSMQRDNSTSTVLHVLHAESITSIVHVQIAMGFKPALPWMAANKREQLKPWSQRESVAKLASEWQLLLQLYAETDLSLAKTNSHNNNASNTNIANTPLV
ncbi:hypothetical protein HMPREF1544_00463 [Mucor circinelloides 1006PhL]|uniref:Protein UNC80 C-terminal domain-containing protein n=1 Tax=Mucor circinelloides f. circinelloides (strain 1006PhL) TaxID=1220926 RepID=S2JRW5_MUCC1|nr:hypothetical protein HMPREF1544_00463 [Mucor circinelloides 1006PhL]